MRKRQFYFVCVFVLIVGFHLGFDLTADARTSLSGPAHEGFSPGSASLVLKVAKKSCQRVFVCDYFAPATSCSAPPCCTKGHWEKNCETKPTGKPSTPSTLKDHPCYPTCQYQCAKTRGNSTFTQCIVDCLRTTRC
jgi:hypothetical protein